MIRCVAFDFDGTLVDSNAIKRDTFFRVVEDFEAGALLMDGILSREDAGDRYWIFEHFAAALNRSEIAHDLADRYTQLCERNIAAAPEIKGALKALKRLRNMGMELFVNSATPEVALKKIIDLRDLGPFFSGVYGAPTDKADHLRTIMKDTEVSADAILMVGDGDPDRLAAEEVSCHFVGVKNTGNSFSQTPRYLVENLGELVEITERL